MTKMAHRKYIESTKQEYGMRIARNLAVLSTVILAAGCAEQPPTNSTYRTYGYTETPGHAGEVISTPRYNQEAADRSLEAGVRQELNRYGDLAAVAPNVQVTARSGAVTLSGTVPSEREREMIEACVKNSTGVASVDNQLRVGYAPTGTYRQTTTVYEPAPAPPVVATTTAPAPAYAQTITPQIVATSDSDNDLAQRVADSIRTDPILPTLVPSVTIHVTGGRVIVRGIVEHGRQKRAIIDAVRRTPGVVEVRDDLKVR